MILRNYSKIIKKTNKEKKMVKDHNFECKGCLKFNTKDDIHYVWINATYVGTFAEAFGKFDKLLDSIFNASLDHYDVREPKVDNSMYEIVHIKEDYK